MTIGIMQPYFLPYIGYWQLMNIVDKFVIYDDIEFSKKGWIHRNRFLRNGEDIMFSLPLKKASDYLYISQRLLSDNFGTESKKIFNKLVASYSKAPYYVEVLPILEAILFYKDKNLFGYILNSINIIKEYLEIKTEIIISSRIDFDNSLKSESKVLAICKSCDADKYINPIGGVGLYSKDNFKSQGVDISFLKAKCSRYNQYNNDFVSALSILDMMMFLNKTKIIELLDNYELQ